MNYDEQRIVSIEGEKKVLIFKLEKMMNSETHDLVQELIELEKEKIGLERDIKDEDTGDRIREAENLLSELSDKVLDNDITGRQIADEISYVILKLPLNN